MPGNSCMGPGVETSESMAACCADICSLVVLQHCASQACMNRDARNVKSGEASSPCQKMAKAQPIEARPGLGSGRHGLLEAGSREPFASRCEQGRSSLFSRCCGNRRAAPSVDLTEASPWRPSPASAKRTDGKPLVAISCLLGG